MEYFRRSCLWKASANTTVKIAIIYYVAISLTRWFFVVLWPSWSVTRAVQNSAVRSMQQTTNAAPSTGSFTVVRHWVSHTPADSENSQVAARAYRLNLTTRMLSFLRRSCVNPQCMRKNFAAHLISVGARVLIIRHYRRRRSIRYPFLIQMIWSCPTHPLRT